MTAAIRENRSTHCEILEMGSRAGAGGRPGSLEGASSTVISAISTNSRSKIRLTNLAGRAAVGLKGPGEEMAGVGMVRGSGCGFPPVETVEAAAASSSNPLLPAADGENMGIFGSVGVSTVEAPDEGPVRVEFLVYRMRVRWAY